MAGLRSAADSGRCGRTISKQLVEQLAALGRDAGACGDGPAGLEVLARAQHEGQPFHAALLDAPRPDKDGVAVERLTRESYDLVLMDVQMPQMDGLEATRIIRAPDSAVRNRQIPIIAMTWQHRGGNSGAPGLNCQPAGLSFAEPAASD